MRDSALILDCYFLIGLTLLLLLIAYQNKSKYTGAAVA
jgi:hypothetical protein